MDRMLKGPLKKVPTVSFVVRFQKRITMETTDKPQASKPLATEFVGVFDLRNTLPLLLRPGKPANFGLRPVLLLLGHLTTYIYIYTLHMVMYAVICSCALLYVCTYLLICLRTEYIYIHT